MEQQEKQVNNTKLAIMTDDFDVYHESRWYNQFKNRLMHFKAAASYATKVIEDPANYTFNAWAKPMWTNKVAGIRIHDNVKVEVATFSWDSFQYDTVIEGLGELYAAVMYVFAAMREARANVIAIGQQEMTPAEIEKEFGLKRGVVRKYIFDNRETLERTGVIRQADARTILCKRGWAICRWGNKK